MGSLAQAIRGIRTQPLVIIVIAATMTLCIGANAALFSVVDRVILAPLPYPNAARLLAIEDRHSANATSVTYGTFLDLESRLSTVESVAAMRSWQFNLTGGS